MRESLLPVRYSIELNSGAPLGIAAARLPSHPQLARATRQSASLATICSTWFHEEAAKLVVEMIELSVFSSGLITTRCLSRLCVPRSVLLP